MKRKNKVEKCVRAFGSSLTRAKQSREKKKQTHIERELKKNTHRINVSRMRQNLIFITFLPFGEWLHILCITLLQHDKIVFIMDFFFNCDEISERLYILRWIPHFHSSKIKQNSNYMKMYLHCSDFFIVRDIGIHFVRNCFSLVAWVAWVVYKK